MDALTSQPPLIDFDLGPTSHLSSSHIISSHHIISTASLSFTARPSIERVDSLVFLAQLIEHNPPGRAMRIPSQEP